MFRYFRYRKNASATRPIPTIYMPAMPPVELTEFLGRWLAARRKGQFRA